MVICGQWCHQHPISEFTGGCGIGNALFTPYWVCTDAWWCYEYGWAQIRFKPELIPWKMLENIAGREVRYFDCRKCIQSLGNTCLQSLQYRYTCQQCFSLKTLLPILPLHNVPKIRSIHQSIFFFNGNISYYRNIDKTPVT